MKKQKSKKKIHVKSTTGSYKLTWKTVEKREKPHSGVEDTASQATALKVIWRVQWDSTVIKFSVKQVYSNIYMKL